MTRNVLIASVSALALSATAAFAGSGCNGGADLTMEQAAMSVGADSGLIQLAGAEGSAPKQEGEKTEVKPGEGQGPSEAVGEQIEAGDKEVEAGQPEVKKEGEAPAAGGAAAPAAEAPAAGGAAAPAGDAAAAGEKTEVKPGEGQGPTEAVGDEAKKSEEQPKDQSEVKQEGDKTKVKPAESPTPAQ